MTGSRQRGILLGLTALIGAGLMLAWSQSWFTLTLAPESGETAPLVIGGDVAASGLAPLALTTFALVLALAISGPVLRMVLGVVQALLGLLVVLVVITTTGDPTTASASRITDVTGLSGEKTIATLVTATEVSVWPTCAIVLGVLLALVGIIVTVTARSWPVSGRKYSRTRTAPADGAAPADAVSEWDALSDGDDPTATDR